MATDTPLSSEHAFMPRENTMTVIFPSSEIARTAISALADADIRADEVELVSGADHPAADTQSPGFKADSPGVEGFDEIAHVLNESFSDDDKAYVEIDRALAAGGALLNLPMTGEQRRSEIASRLRSEGATAIYYLDALVTEQL